MLGDVDPTGILADDVAVDRFRGVETVEGVGVRE